MIKHITSRNNPFIKSLRRLSQDASAYRKSGQFWLEGDHLCRAALARGVRPVQAVFAETLWAACAQDWQDTDADVYIVSDVVFESISHLESPARMGFVCATPQTCAIDPDESTVVLDRLQDAGNVGAILRCASAFGFKQILALKGTAALWSTKVLRAAMGAHFGLQLHEGLAVQDLTVLRVPILTTSSHEGPYLHALTADGTLPARAAWVMGHEGQGVSADIQQRASMQVRIAQPGGEESLNVATAAAICLHASATSQVP